ncbi:MAG: hypothetical protein F4Z04_05405 [Acidobacteria bacterium]|nr:hypothetical protein [Acidobacteriota bacterium]MYA07645.1 hypothetical protein [Holophagales bacterium]MYG31899.1 hypothetical protein [Holophagales bacterium]MYI79741.1 hypothetical protein [Holophagales bacterium]
MSKARIATFWLPLVGLFPSFLALAVIESHVHPRMVEYWVGDLVRDLGSNARFAQGLFVTSTVVACYIAVCCALLAYFCLGITRSSLPRARKKELAWTAVVLWIGFHGLLYGLTFLDLQLFDIAYGALVQVYGAAGSPVTESMTGPMVIPFLSRHLLSVLIPTAMAVAAVCAGSCHAVAIVESAGPDEGDAGKATTSLLHSLMAMSGLLVASSVLITVYFHLPAKLYASSEAASAYRDFAGAVSAFWGAILTLTLVAVYVPPAVGLRSLAGVPLSQLLNTGLDRTSVFLGSLKKSEAVVAALAPFLASLVANIL